MTDDAALPVAKLIPLARSMQHCYSHRHFAPNLAAASFFAEYFPPLRGNGRFPRHRLHHAAAPPKSPVLTHAIHHYGSRVPGSPHAGRKPARIPAPSVSV
jgi:hypothetical protein